MAFRTRFRRVETVAEPGHVRGGTGTRPCDLAGRTLGVQRVIKRGSFTSVTALVRRIHDFTREYNQDASPFVWAATAESILEKTDRLSKRISDSQR